jgi:hypothetical protein
MHEKIFFMHQESIVTAIERILLCDPEVFPQQLGHRAVIKPVTMKAPFTARIDQPIANQCL